MTPPIPNQSSGEEKITKKFMFYANKKSKEQLEAESSVNKITVKEFNNLDKAWDSGKLWVCSSHTPRIIYEDDDLVIHKKNKTDNGLLCPAIAGLIFKRECRNRLYSGSRKYFEEEAYNKIQP